MKFEDEFFKKEKVTSILAWCYFFSAAVHIVFFTVHLLSLNSENLIPTDSIPIEISNISEKQFQSFEKQLKQNKHKPNLERQIVESEKANNEEIDENTKYLSDKNQKITKQTRAAKVDDFKEKKGTGVKNSITVKTNEQDEIANEYGLSEVKVKKKEWKALSLQDLSVGNGDGGDLASSDDKIDGVDRGESTMLSTREFKYFGYYHRIKELLRQHWKPGVEHQMERIWRKGRQISSDELTTKVLVTLNDKGKLTKISKLSGSGFSEIDEAAIEAFERAAPFPNPPQAMVDADGFVRIRWDFVLTADSGPRIQFRNAGADPRY